MRPRRSWVEAVRVLVVDGANRVRHLTLHTVHHEPRQPRRSDPVGYQRWHEDEFQRQMDEQYTDQPPPNAA